MKPHKFKHGLVFGPLCTCGRPYEADIHAYDETVEKTKPQQEEWEEKFENWLPWVPIYLQPEDAKRMDVELKAFITDLLRTEKERHDEADKNTTNDLAEVLSACYHAGQQDAYAKIRDMIGNKIYREMPRYGFRKLYANGDHEWIKDEFTANLHNKALYDLDAQVVEESQKKPLKP